MSNTTNKKQFVRGLIIFIVVQVLITVFFFFLLIECSPVDLKDMKQLDIVVESIDYKRVISEYRMDIYSDSVRYSFNSRSTISECSVSELYDKIKVGDRLSVIFYEKNSIFDKQNLIIDARVETEIYRSVEEYNNGKSTLKTVIIFVLCIVEILFLSILALFIYINRNVIKCLHL
ncbi:MAG: hypothetical protein J6D27_08970 [Ruminiclostridium sp.]|nr:hypothetical protein [Ruminiclostridium sp.]